MVVSDGITIFSVVGVSYNRPRFHRYATWVSNGITIAANSILGASPWGLFVDVNNTLYAASRANDRIHVWLEGQSVPRTFYYPLSYPKSIFASTNGDIFFDNGYSNKKVILLTANMTTNSTVMAVENDCYGLFVDITNILYCSLFDEHKVVAKSLTSADDTWIIAAGTGCLGSTSNQLKNPLGIFVNTNLDLYVADSGNDRIQLFSADRVVGRTVSIDGSTGPWTLNTPSSVILDGDGYLFISDSNNHRILGSGPDGFRCIIGCEGIGSTSNKLYIPRTISFDSYGNLFVVDHINDRIQKFNLIPNTYTREFLMNTGCCESSSRSLRHLILL